MVRASDVTPSELVDLYLVFSSDIAHAASLDGVPLSMQSETAALDEKRRFAWKAGIRLAAPDLAEWHARAARLEKR
jgi:hypothetical protein